MRSPCGPVLSGGNLGNGGDQFAGVGLLRGGEQAVYVAMLHHLAGAQHRDAVGDPPDRRQIVGNEQVAQTQLLL